MYNSLLITPAVLNHRAADRYRAAEHWPPGHRDLEKNIKETLLYAYCILLTDDEQAHPYVFIDLKLTQYITVMLLECDNVTVY